LVSCKCDLPPDEELRQGLVGQWHQDGCWYPYTVDNRDYEYNSPMNNIIAFFPDGHFIEAGRDSTGAAIVAGCGHKAYCVLDSCDSQSFCTCLWFINDGVLTLINEGNTDDPARLNIEYPIVCLDDDKFVVNHVDFNGNRTKKACFKRYNGVIKLD
jgi:hypothetical protein